MVRQASNVKKHDHIQCQRNDNPYKSLHPASVETHLWADTGFE